MRYQKRLKGKKREQYNRTLIASRFKSQRKRASIITPRPIAYHVAEAKKQIYGGRGHEE